MSTNLADLLQSKFINSWNLFWLITLPISTVMVFSMMGVELSSGRAVSSMIQLSVRCAVPLLFVAFAASSVNVLFPGLFGRWILRNRKFIGLSFAAAMAWQLFFILWMVTQYTEYFVEEVYALSDVIEGVGGYLLLIAMVITTFKLAATACLPNSGSSCTRVGFTGCGYTPGSPTGSTCSTLTSPLLSIMFTTGRVSWPGACGWQHGLKNAGHKQLGRRRPGVQASY